MKKLLVLAVIAVIWIGCDQPFKFITFSVRDGKLGEAYADTIRTEGGHGNKSMHVVSGELPPGIGLRTEVNDGILYGVPSRAGDFSFTVEARDSAFGEEPEPTNIITHGFAIKVDSL